jgi:2-dehydropantoate 2-reductase
MFGAGVIGSLYGYALAQAGVDVTHYVRPGKKAELAGGLALHLLDGREKNAPETSVVYRPKVVECLSPDEGYDFYIVSVRHYQIPSVLPILRQNLGAAEVLFFNGNWAGFDAVEQTLPAGKYLWGFPVAGGGFQPDGTLNAALLDEVRLGEPDGRITPRVERLKAMFERARLKVELVPNIQHWLWVHFAINSGIIGAAFKAGGAPQLLNSIPRLHDAILAGREALAVCAARGVDVRAYADAQAFTQPAWLGAAALWLMMRTNRPARQIMETHTAVDELQVIYRDVFQMGVVLSVAMPHYRALQPYVDSPRLTGQPVAPHATRQ